MSFNKDIIETALRKFENDHPSIARDERAVISIIYQELELEEAFFLKRVAGQSQDRAVNSELRECLKDSLQTVKQSIAFDKKIRVTHVFADDLTISAQHPHFCFE